MCCKLPNFSRNLYFTFSTESRETTLFIWQLEMYCTGNDGLHAGVGGYGGGGQAGRYNFGGKDDILRQAEQGNVIGHPTQGGGDVGVRYG